MNNKIKHLEMIQAVISRLAGNSFTVKNWAITISLAIFGAFFSSGKPIFLSLAIFSTVIFWIMDSYYLRQERLFRRLYKDYSIRKTNISDFSMDTSSYDGEEYCLVCMMFSFPLLVPYTGALLMTVLLYFAKF